MKFSIIIPMYNVENYIKQCVDSCLKQTYKNYEIIIIDDESNDKSLNIVKNYYSNYSNIKIYTQQKSGVSAARNKGIKESDGEWIVFLDGDDWLDKNALKNYKKTIENNNDADIIITNYFTNTKKHEKEDSFFNDCVDILDSNDKIELIKSSICSSKISNLKSSTNVGVPWAKAYRSSFIKNNKLLFAPGLKRMQDMIFNLNAFYLSNVVIYNKSYTYHYRINNNSATKKYNSDFDTTTKRILKEIEIFINNNELSYELDDYYISKSIKLLIEMIRVQYCVPENKKSIKNKTNEIKRLLNEKPFNNKNVNINLLSKNERIIYFLLRHRLVFLTLIIYDIKYLYTKCKEDINDYLFNMLSSFNNSNKSI